MRLSYIGAVVDLDQLFLGHDHGVSKMTPIACL